MTTTESKNREEQLRVIASLLARERSYMGTSLKQGYYNRSVDKEPRRVVEEAESLERKIKRVGTLTLAAFALDSVGEIPIELKRQLVEANKAFEEIWS